MSKNVDKVEVVDVPDTAPVSTESLALPMPCHYIDKTEWKPGTIVHFTMTGHGLRALIKPVDSNRFVEAGIGSVAHGSAKPETPAS